MKNPEISVIVPVFNAEKYLCKCIDSILAQSFCNFELLLIDDGSFDNSSEICDDYAGKDKRIKVFHKTNEGISATREFGMQCAEGEYIQFVDSDDWIDSNMLSIMYGKAIENDADIVGCNFIQEYANKSLKTTVCFEDREGLLSSVISNYWGVLWKFLIRKKMFDIGNIHFPVGVNGGEDYYVVTSLLLVSQKVVYVDFYPYHYVRYNADSFISKKSLEKELLQVTATILVEKKLENVGLKNKYLNELNKRKFQTKLNILCKHFLVGCILFPELPILSQIKKQNIKVKILILASVIVRFILLRINYKNK